VTTHAFDWPRLARTVDLVRQRHGLTDAELAGELGLCRSTLGRLRAGGHVDADTVATLLAWINPLIMPTWIVPRSEMLDTKGNQCPSGSSSPSS
jgi:transcriptional regulator with XRE-family HTH domain